MGAGTARPMFRGASGERQHGIPPVGCRLGPQAQGAGWGCRGRSPATRTLRFADTRMPVAASQGQAPAASGHPGILPRTQQVLDTVTLMS
jgi:hypothetical protein